jgi:hypothetical protein
MKRQIMHKIVQEKIAFVDDCLPFCYLSGKGHGL